MSYCQIESQNKQDQTLGQVCFLKSRVSGFTGDLGLIFPVMCINSFCKTMDVDEGVGFAMMNHITSPLYGCQQSAVSPPLLNWKHGRFRRIQALASACALCLTTYYHVPKYF